MSDSPRLPGICLTYAQHARSRHREIGRLLKSLAHVAPDRHDQAVAIYTQALLEHGQLGGELNQMINHMQAAKIAGVMLPEQPEDQAGLVPIPCRMPPEVPLVSQPTLVLEVERVDTGSSVRLIEPPRRREWSALDNKSRAAGEREEE